jgi:hypothetical protein
MSMNDPDARARAVEEQMTDDERFSLIVSVMGSNPVNPARDDRIPDGTPMSAGYVPRVWQPSVESPHRSLMPIAQTQLSGESRTDTERSTARHMPASPGPAIQSSDRG